MADFMFNQIPAENIRSGTDIIQTSGREAIGKGPGRYVCDSLADASLFAAHPRFVGRSSNGRYFRALPEAGRVAVELSGAKGDGITDDGGAIRASFAYAAAIGAQGARFTQAKHRMESIPVGESPFPFAAQPSLIIPATPAIHDWGGVELTRQLNGRGIAFTHTHIGGIVELPLIADVVTGATQVRLSAADAAKLAPGDLVGWQLGELSYDTPETLNWDIVKVVAVSGEYVTLDKPIPAGLVLASVTGPNKRLRKMPVLRDFAMRDLTITASNCETGVEIYGGKRIRLDRIGGSNLGAGLMVAQYCDGVTLTDCWQDGVILSQASFGSAFSFAECRNVVLIRPHARATLGLVRAEAGAEVAIVGGHFDNTILDGNNQSLGTNVMVLNAAGRGVISAHDLTITGYGGYRLAETSNGVAEYNGTINLTGITRLRHPTMPFSIPVGTITGTLDMEIGGVREVHDFMRLRRWKRRFALRDNEYVYAFGPPGILVRGSFYTSPGLTVGANQQLTGMWLGRAGDNGANIAAGVNGQLIPGSDTAVHIYGGSVGGAMWNLRNSSLQLLCITGASAGLDTANRFVEFEAWLTTRPGDDFSVSEADWRAASGDGNEMEALFPAYDLPSVLAGGSLTIDLPIPAMQPGDFIEAIRSTGGLNGLALSSVESRTGSARIVLSNAGTAPIDKAPSDLAVRFARAQLGR